MPLFNPVNPSVQSGKAVFGHCGWDLPKDIVPCLHLKAGHPRSGKARATALDHIAKDGPSCYTSMNTFSVVLSSSLLYLWLINVFDLQKHAWRTNSHCLVFKNAGQSDVTCMKNCEIKERIIWMVHGCSWRVDTRLYGKMQTDKLHRAGTLSTANWGYMFCFQVATYYWFE